MNDKTQVTEYMAAAVKQAHILISKGALTSFTIDFETNGKKYTLSLVETNIVKLDQINKDQIN